jgi:pilus assembly protein FimV
VVSGEEEGAAPIWEKWLDQLPDDDESRIAIGAGVLLIMLVLWLMVRRRRSLMTMEESILMTGGTLDGTVSQLSEIRSKKPRYLSDLSIAGMGRIESTEVDPLAEAEVYLAYGRAGQAVQVLKDAVKRNPQRQELQLKLLEAYQQQNDVTSFDDLVSEMNLSEATADQLAWNKVVELKLKMHEHGPLGLAGNAGVAADVKENVSTQSNDRDWVLAQDDDSDLRDDPSEDLPEAAASHELLTKSSGLIDPTLRPFPEPDDNARVGEDVLGMLGRPSGLSEAEGLKADLPPGDPEMMNFNTTSVSELNFELDPDEDELGESPAGSPGQDSDIDLTQLLSSKPESNQGQAPNEVSIKAELAEAYLNMGDKDEALRILEEIIGAAGPDQKQQIADLIRRANQ